MHIRPNVNERIDSRGNNARSSELLVIYCNGGEAMKRARTGSVQSMGKTSKEAEVCMDLRT
jgi:hypothetical protein